MSKQFKPLGLAVAVAAATGAGVVSASPGTSLNTGDAAVVPYYSVQDGRNTGVHIINTTDKTQVVKFRMRRGSDSQDALDFNIIMSPNDVWVGSIQKDDDERIFVQSSDTTCTTPAFTDNRVFMPDTGLNYREGADEGYIEIIGMGEPLSESMSVAVGAEHDDGVPESCDLVEDNFFRVTATTDPTEKGVHTAGITANGDPDLDECSTSADVIAAVTGYLGNPNSTTLEPVLDCGLSIYDDTTDDALVVSWFVRNSEEGLEFGGNAYHLQSFSGPGEAMITNQQALALVDGEPVGDPLNFELPDLDGGPLLSTAAALAGIPDNTLRNKYSTIVRPALNNVGGGAKTTIFNDWSARSTANFNVSTDWVVTIPGQYLMRNRVEYALGPVDCIDETTKKDYNTEVGGPGADGQMPEEVCNFQDLPLLVESKFYDREEDEFESEDDLVVSPGIDPLQRARFNFEVNVVEWDKGQGAVLDSDYAVAFSPQVEADNGWARVTMSPVSTKTRYVDNLIDPNTPIVKIEDSVPVIGFAVWERSFGNNPDANYGRAIDHSYDSSP